MAVFAYEAKTTAGDLRRGEVEAKNQAAAKTLLRKRQLSPTSLKKKGRLFGDIPQPG